MHRAENGVFVCVLVNCHGKLWFCAIMIEFPSFNISLWSRFERSELSLWARLTSCQSSCCTGVFFLPHIIVRQPLRHNDKTRSLTYQNSFWTRIKFANTFNEVVFTRIREILMTLTISINRHMELACEFVRSLEIIPNVHKNGIQRQRFLKMKRIFYQFLQVYLTFDFHSIFSISWSISDILCRFFQSRDKECEEARFSFRHFQVLPILTTVILSCYKAKGVQNNRTTTYIFKFVNQSFCVIKAFRCQNSVPVWRIIGMVLSNRGSRIKSFCVANQICVSRNTVLGCKQSRNFEALSLKFSKNVKITRKQSMTFSQWLGKRNQTLFTKFVKKIETPLVFAGSFFRWNQKSFS